MARIEDLLSPDEEVLMDSPATDDKGVLRRLPGKLYLTSERLVFIPGKAGLLQGLARGDRYADLRAPDAATSIPLTTIRAMDTEGNNLIVFAGQRYVFSDVAGGEEWALAIKEARGGLASAPSPSLPPHPSPPLHPGPAETPAMSSAPTEARRVNFCGSCGAKVNPGAKYCTYCGNRLTG